MLKVIDKKYIHQNWHLVKDYLTEALQFSDEYTADQVKVFLANGQWLLIAALKDNNIKGCCTVVFINYPNDRVAFVTAIGGKFISDKNIYNEFVSMLKTFGATKVQGAARPSIVRLWRRLGFAEKYSIVETKI